MLSKSQSCDRCIRTKSSLLGSHESHLKTEKKPQSYLIKKFDQLHDEERRLRNKRKEKIDQNIKKKEEKQLKECTFRPSVKNNPQYHVSGDHFLKREQDWKRAIDRRLAEKRQQQERKISKIATFQPKIKNPSIVSSGLNYTSRNNNTGKKSYKVIHSEKKKFQVLAKTIIVEPFKHRRMNTTTESTQRMQNSNHYEREIGEQPTQPIQQPFEKQEKLAFDKTPEKEDKNEQTVNKQSEEKIVPEEQVHDSNIEINEFDCKQDEEVLNQVGQNIDEQADNESQNSSHEQQGF